MGKTQKQWRNIIKKMSDVNLKVLHDSLLKLSMWKEFDKEYAWTSYKTIKLLIKQEIDSRKEFEK